MPPKQAMSKKNKAKKQEQALSDQTFGLKNKNKSAKVQQFVSLMTQSSKNNLIDKNAAKMKEQKDNAKLAKKMEEETLRELMNEGIVGQFGKNKKELQKKAAEAGLDKVDVEIQKVMEERFASDSDSDSEDDMPYIVDDGGVVIEAEVVYKEKTAEDIIEEQRAKLAAEGKKGTPVTEASFAIWRAAKLKRRQEEAEARALAELSKKKGGKGLSILSGKELFNFNASLFVDDDSAINAAQEDALNKEMLALREAEEKLAQEEAERAQKLQEQLREAEELEEAYRVQRIKEWREAAAKPDKVVFLFGDVKVNEIIFIGYDADEKEDLEPFPEYKEEVEGEGDMAQGVEVDLEKKLVI